MPETVEEISEKPEVREELARTAGEKPREKVKARARDKFWFVTHALLLVGCAIIYFLLGSKFFAICLQKLRSMNWKCTSDRASSFALAKTPGWMRSCSTLFRPAKLAESKRV
jgi:hypothetical protein